MRNIALQLSFLGTHYHGWQVQRDAPTVQQTVSDAVSRLTGAPTLVRGCSRTDAGVHALQYVAHFFTATAIPLPACVAGLNALLPPDIAIQQAAEMPAAFDARRAAIAKTYRYLLYEAPVRHPWLAPMAWWRKRPLDLTAMQSAALGLCGTHDFSAFCAANDVSRVKRRTLTACRITRHAMADAFPLWTHSCQPWQAGATSVPQILAIDLTADGFLKQMARTVVGTLVEVGNGKRAPESIAALLQGGDRRAAGVCAPPQGLWLLAVEYPGPIWGTT